MKFNWKKSLFYTFSLLFVGVGAYGVVQGTGDIDSYTANLYTSQGSAAANSGTIGIATLGTDSDKGGGLINVIKNAINRVLGMLSLIALILCLWGGFQIVTAAGDDTKQKKGMSVLKHAAFGLIVIGLAWFIVTIVFWLLRGVAGTPTT